ncbi:MAG: glycosyltransferase family 2 protein [Acidimicrobiales bacterium]
MSVGMPVRNGGRYLDGAVAAILGQSAGDLELIIADNGSIDDTADIARRWAAADPRVVYRRDEAPLPPAANFNRLIGWARGEHFKWCAADDLHEPTFLERCLTVLDAAPEVVLCCTATVSVDSEGAVLGPVENEPDLDQPRPHQRLASLLSVDLRRYGAHELYGVIRLPVLRATAGLGSHVRGDNALLANLALRGRLHRVAEPLFVNRDHGERSSRRDTVADVRPDSRLAALLGPGPLPSAGWWDPAARGRIVFPEWRVLGELLRAVRTAPLDADERARCLAIWARYGLRNGPKLLRDTLIAGEQAGRRGLRRTIRLVGA